METIPKNLALTLTRRQLYDRVPDGSDRPLRQGVEPRRERDCVGRSDGLPGPDA
jgi:hypothetical protein